MGWDGVKMLRSINLVRARRPPPLAPSWSLAVASNSGKAFSREGTTGAGKGAGRSSGFALVRSFRIGPSTADGLALSATGSGVVRPGARALDGSALRLRLDRSNQLTRVF